jgi:hypothetical protein
MLENTVTPEGIGTYNDQLAIVQIRKSTRHSLQRVLLELGVTTFAIQKICKERRD